MTRSVRRQIVGLTLFWVALIVLVHVLDHREYHGDVGIVIDKSVALVDEGRLDFEGTDVFIPRQGAGLYIGPLAQIVSALPLLLTRDIHYHYYFFSLLFALAVALFYLACREIRSAGVFKFIATFIFALCFVAHHLILLPDNTALRPLFLALYFYLLTRSLRGGPALLVLLWISVGLGLQTNFSLLLLVPVTLVVRPPRTRVELGWTLAGMALAAAINFSAIARLLAMLSGGGGGSSLWAGQANASPLSFGIYWKYLVTWLGVPFLYVLVLPLSILGILAFVEFKKEIWRNWTRLPALGVVACWAFAVPLFSVSAALKGKYFNFYYFDSAIVFGAPLAASFLERCFSAEASRRRRRIGVAAWGLLVSFYLVLGVSILVLFHAAPPCYPEYCRLNTQIAVAERINRTVVDHHLSRIEIADQPYDLHGKTLMRHYSCYYQALCKYIFPDLERRLAEDRPDKILHVIVVPDPTKNLRRLVPARPADAEKLDEFSAGELFVTLYLTSGEIQELPLMDFRTGEAAPFI